MTQDSFSFVIYLIHACSDQWNVPPTRVYKILKESGCLKNYLVPYYDILHTQSTQYMVEDIYNYLKNRNVVV